MFTSCERMGWGRRPFPSGIREVPIVKDKILDITTPRLCTTCSAKVNFYGQFWTGIHTEFRIVRFVLDRLKKIGDFFSMMWYNGIK